MNRGLSFYINMLLTTSGLSSSKWNKPERLFPERSIEDGSGRPGTEPGTPD
jgi:hypothetical protein